ncbi:MAG: tRNA 2-thiocytidine biosynthesis protein TtcA [Candidatus Cloacimonetes bacterium]|nr:tRNA 2-thiocytidine biosynthesis protein TtcA [Candidatus Cloacimonadota bacterium]
MELRRDFSKALEPVCSEIIRTIREYGLIEHNERIGVAVSGGKDSVGLLYLLWYINKYSYQKFEIVAMHVRTAEYDTAPLSEMCRLLEIEYFDLKINMERITAEKSICYSCSRFKRVAMWEKMEELGITKLAMGHHAGDAVETFFMNLFEHSRIESIRPKVVYEKYPLIVIRPMITLSEDKIVKIFRDRDLPMLSYKCPFDEENIRSKFRINVKDMSSLFGIPGIQARVIKALKQNDPKDCWINDEVIENKLNDKNEDFC